MKYTLPLIALVAMAALVGCKNNKKSPQTNPAVTHITPVASSPSYTAPVYTPAKTYTPSYTPAPAPVAPTVAASGTTYTIRKGDTLYSIARTHYGNGKDWQRIASANPGLDPTKLRVGQSIVIP